MSIATRHAPQQTMPLINIHPEVLDLILDYLSAEELALLSRTTPDLEQPLLEHLVRRAQYNGSYIETVQRTSRQLAKLESRHNDARMPVAAGDSESSFFVTEDGKLKYVENSDTFHCSDVNVQYLQNRTIKSVFFRGNIWAAITQQGEVYTCYGDGFLQQNQTPFTVISLPTLVHIPELVISLAVGLNHSLAVTESGALVSWGYSEHGQCGHGITSSEYSTPQFVQGIGRVRNASAGSLHSLAVTEDGALYSFGCGTRGQLGHGTVAPGNTTTPLCEGGYESTPSPKKVNFDFHMGGRHREHVVGTAAGINHSVALTADGRVYTWGDNEVGQLGMSECIVTIAVPQLVGYIGGAGGFNGINKTKVCRVATGWESSFAITESGELFHWGLNRDELVVHDDIMDMDSRKYYNSFPYAVQAIGKHVIVAVSSASTHTIAVTDRGEVYGCTNGVHLSPSTWRKYDNIQCVKPFPRHT